MNPANEIVGPNDLRYDRQRTPADLRSRGCYPQFSSCTQPASESEDDGLSARLDGRAEGRRTRDQ